MDHPFEVGQTYQNARGAYTVLEITPPKMRIRYADGSNDSVTIAIQQRIWDRIKTEREYAARERRQKITAGRPSISFSGLEDSDFKEKIEGTSWRGREGLGGLVALQLSTMCGKEFVSLAIYPQSRFFVYPPQLPMNSQQDGVKLPKFEVRLNAEKLRYSFHVEKSDRPMGDEWYWARFLQLLSEPYWQESLSSVIEERGLSWILHFEESDAELGPYLPEDKTKIDAFGPNSEFPSFAAFVDHLHELPAHQWCNLYLGTTMSKKEAIDLGVRVSQPISHTFNALAPMFLTLLG